MQSGTWLAAGLLVAALLGLAPQSQAAVVLTTWDEGTSAGWTSSTSPYGRWEAMSSGGNPGGYIRFYDLNSTYTADDLHAPASYLGDYSDFIPEARFEFDLRSETPTNFYVTILMSGPGGRFLHRTPALTTSWMHYVLPLQPQSWTLSMGTWTGLLANITDIRIVGDVVTGHNQAELALDNFLLVPEPATLLLVGLAVLPLLRRRP